MLFHVRPRSFCAFIAFLLQLGSCEHLEPHKERTQTFFQALPWYHTSADIHDTVQRLSENCGNAELSLSKIESPEGVKLDVVRVKRNGTTDRMKAMMFFGVHCREMFGTETGLDFVKNLCGEGENKEWASKLLDSVEFTIVPNANPMGRKEVETGDFCKRTNEHGVDLNRNWGFDGHQGPEQKSSESNPGPNSFSEPESKLLRGLVDQEKPTLFLDVHTGSYLLGTPWTYDPKLVPEDQPAMLQMLDTISSKYCNGGTCPFGNAADLVGYPAPGTDMDYVKAKAQTPFVFTWEIYVGDSIRPTYLEKAAAQRRGASLLSESEGPDGLIETDARNDQFLKSKNHRQHERKLRGIHSDTLSAEGDGVQITRDNRACLEQFNPLEEEETKRLVNNWSKAYLELTDMVLAHVNSKNATRPPSL